jgi:hypothetical protein
MFILRLCIILLTLGLSIQSAHAQTITGNACDLATSIAGQGQSEAWRAPPPNCAGVQFLAIRKTASASGIIANVTNPYCIAPTASKSEVELVASALVAYYVTKNPAGVARIATALEDQLGSAIAKGAKKILEDAGLPGFISDAFEKRGPYGNCIKLVAMIPPAAKIKGFRMISASMRAGPIGPCEVDQDCGGWAKFMYHPKVSKGQGYQAVMVDYINWSHNTDQTAILIVFFELPLGAESVLPLI